MLLGGVGASSSGLAEKDLKSWHARLAIGFDLEVATKSAVYEQLEPVVETMVRRAFDETNQFENISANWIKKNPHLVPILMHALGIFSKRDFQKKLGVSQISDHQISEPVSVKIFDLFEGVDSSELTNATQVIQRMKGTTEGIVRDLVGRVLLEDFVAAALDSEEIEYLREDDYSGITGVVYDFRADFVIGDPTNPAAFIEVRKSSAGHASLYAKDKMFSAINWKGKHKDCLGILVTDGPWTRQTLQTLAEVFDYVVPIQRVALVASLLKRYLEGDKGVLNWVINFEINKPQ